MAYNKVEANGETLIDLTGDTVTADTLVSGRTAHLASGERIIGTFEPVTGVKGNAETEYRTGNVNLTAANIGAATSAQGTKADSAVQTIKMNGNAVTKTSGVVDLGTVITAHQDISGKADKSATVSNVTYDTTNKKLTKTINGTTSDVVTTAQLKTDMALSKSDVGLGNVGNFKAVSTVASQGLTDTEKANARTNIGAGTSSFDGNYNSLSNKPTIPTVNNGTLTIQKNGTNVATFTANQSENSTANINTTDNISLTGAVEGSGTLNNGTISAVTNRKSCYVGNSSGSAITNSWFLTAQVDVANNAYVYKATFYVELGIDTTLNNVGILEVVVRKISGTLQYMKAKWIVAGSKINVNDFALSYDSTSHLCSLYINRPVAYSVYRLTSIAESERGGGGDKADVWTLYNNTSTGIASLPSGTGITTIYSELADTHLSQELDCLLIQAALVNNEVVIQNTSDFTSELFSKYYSYTKPKFAILNLQISSNTYYYKALLNSSFDGQWNFMEASFITLANGEYIYNFTWLKAFTTVGTPTVIRKALNLGS